MYDNDCLFCCIIMKTISVLDIFDKVQWVDKNWDGDFPEHGKVTDCPYYCCL